MVDPNFEMRIRNVEEQLRQVQNRLSRALDTLGWAIAQLVRIRES